MPTYTTFKVIKIIDEYSLVINGGLDDDVSLGDTIEIFIKGDEIIDPFQENKVLGTLDFIKERLSVSEVYPGFSVCKKEIEKERYTPSAFEKAIIKPFAGMQGRTEIERVVEPININKDEISHRKLDSEVISIGDTARIAVSS